jgi:putative oxidoreductase
MSFLQGFLGFVGRVALCAIFGLSGYHLAMTFADIAPEMAKRGVPYPEPALITAIVFLGVGSVSVLFGYKARFGAFLLLLFLGAATYYFHDFWRITDPNRMKEWEGQLQHAMKNLSMAGAMLFIIANGAGPGSVDHMLKAKTPTSPVPPVRP